MTIDEFNKKVNAMRNRVMGRGMQPVVKNKKLLADVEKFVRGWRAWSKGPGTLDPLKDTAPFVKRYNALVTRVNASPELKKKKPLKRVKKITQFELPLPIREGAEELGKMFAWGLGIYAGITLLGSLSNRGGNE